MPEPNGCKHLEKTVRIWNQKREKHEWVDLYCGKVVSEGFLLCPHHILMLTEQDSSNAARAQKSANARVRKKMMRESLQNSPLAVNQETTGYEI